MTTPDDPTPDTAMASGSDAGGPGARLGPGDLSPDEERLLAALERGGAPRGTSFPEETQAAVSAAADELPLPGDGAAPDDGLTPSFRAPETD
jgi:hypothetical protein